jgi:hypothetical protein
MYCTCVSNFIRSNKVHYMGTYLPGWAGPSSNYLEEYRHEAKNLGIYYVSGLEGKKLK